MNEWTISQSAISLDISDDESKFKEKSDRGKENIDPNEVSAPLTRSMAAAKAASEDLKQDIMTDDRSPLGDLNPAHYYAEGLDATSVVLVQEEPAEEKHDPEPETAVEQPIPSEHDFTFSAPQSDDLATADIGAVILSAQPKWEAEQTVATDAKPEALDIPHSEDIEIWESESAKDENENEGQKQLCDLEGKLVDEGVVLQELC